MFALCFVPHVCVVYVALFCFVLRFFRIALVCDLECCVLRCVVLHRCFCCDYCIVLRSPCLRLTCFVLFCRTLFCFIFVSPYLGSLCCAMFCNGLECFALHQFALHCVDLPCFVLFRFAMLRVASGTEPARVRRGNGARTKTKRLL